MGLSPGKCRTNHMPQAVCHAMFQSRDFVVKKRGGLADRVAKPHHLPPDTLSNINPAVQRLHLEAVCHRMEEASGTKK